MKRLEFHITYFCNHECIFCSEDERMVKYSNYPLSILQIKTILVDRAKKGFNHVNFTGGEPTLLPKFLELLAFTKKLGYKIYVGTNGTMFESDDFSQKALEYIDELSLSVHWFNQDTCIEQTGDAKHFDRFKDISKNINLFKKNNFFFSNVVINKLNYKNTLNIIQFLKESGYPLQQVLVSVIAPEGKADTDFGTLVFDLYDFQSYIPGIVDYCKKNNITLRFFGLPTCILGEQYTDFANDAHWEERHTIERFTNTKGNIALVDIYSPDNSRKRTFVPKCTDCIWREKPCTGVFKKYLDYYSF